MGASDLTMGGRLKQCESRGIATKFHRIRSLYTCQLEREPMVSIRNSFKTVIISRGIVDVTSSSRAIVIEPTHNSS